MELLEFEARWRGGRPQGIKGGRLGGRPRSPDRPIASRLIEDVRSVAGGARPSDEGGAIEDVRHRAATVGGGRSNARGRP